MLEETANYAAYLLSTLVILITIIGSIYALYTALDKRTKESEERLSKEISKINTSIKDLDTKINNLAGRVSHIEGRLDQLYPPGIDKTAA